jgi:hypothetical protein
MKHIWIAIVFGVLLSTPARAELLHVELKTLGMD